MKPEYEVTGVKVSRTHLELHITRKCTNSSDTESEDEGYYESQEICEQQWLEVVGGVLVHPLQKLRNNKYEYYLIGTEKGFEVVGMERYRRKKHKTKRRQRSRSPRRRNSWH